MSRAALGALLVSTLLIAASARAQSLDPGETALKMEGWIPNTPNVMDLTFLPDGRTVIVHRAGDVSIRTKEGMVLRNVAKVAIKPLADTEHGLLGVVPHPDFATNHILFFHATVGEAIAEKGQVIRGTLTDD